MVILYHVYLLHGKYTEHIENELRNLREKFGEKIHIAILSRARKQFKSTKLYNQQKISNFLVVIFCDHNLSEYGLVTKNVHPGSWVVELLHHLNEKCLRRRLSVVN